ncbi:hypothetical protein CMV30_12500 [Nibricoccus aquaticus]|uniref:Glycosyltransferase RgtA/B/C/D-like domain-containing protein n=1 Tax=Nibricoccus aquaticus TaxID=2576891 RepID=A0A290Q8E6_9BACT|nr:hypothetical protein CMV30_12500 [Nibricoccus aquaticus]
MNFENPGEPFQLMARLDATDGWAAVSGPVSVGLLSWVMPKVTGLWGWLLGSGAILGVVSGWFWARRSSGLNAEQPGVLSGKDARFLPWLALAAYAVIVAQGVDSAAGGSDSSGYLNNARMMLEGKLSIPPRAVAGVSVEEFGLDIVSPMPFKEAAVAGEIAPITAPGLALMCAAVGCVLPLHTAVSVVIFANLLLGILFTRLLAEEFGLSWKWAWVAGFGIGLSPLYLFIGLQPLSDGPSLTWVTAAIYFAWVSRRKAGYAWLAGGATAIAVLLRPPNFLCVVPILLCLAGSWHRCVSWAVGGIPGAAFQFWYSWRVWGSPFTSGYDKVGDVVKLEYLPANAAHYAFWLPWLLTPVVLFVFALPFIRRPGGLARMVLGTWIGVFLGFYGVFAFTREAWWFLRFILPAFPALMIAALLGAREMSERFNASRFLGGPRRSRELLAIGMLGLLLLAVHERRVFFWLGRDRNLIQAAKWLKENAAPGSPVLSVQGAGTVFYYTDLPVILYFHDVVRESPDFARALKDGGKDVYAFMFHFERPDARPDFLGEWEQMASFQEDGVKIWKLRRPEAGKP